MDKTQYKEFRKDGWPLCPKCGEDELYSQMPWTDESNKPTIGEFIEGGLQCYRCQWQSNERWRYVIKVTGLDKLQESIERTNSGPF